MTLFTIGYEQAKSASVIDELKHARVELVVDTRAVAASRRPGFSKRQLAAGLDEAGIGYLHLQKLGTPKEGRDAARSGNLAKLFAVYEKQLATPEAREQLDELTAIVALRPPGVPVVLRARRRPLPPQAHRRADLRTDRRERRASRGAAVLIAHDPKIPSRSDLRPSRAARPLNKR